ncbi:hypothetical protein GOQ29_03440, partial [Clostridium sp. D2Q-14]|uniref:condensation domain-containing protein n=1 Tax=Anaeromonas gelatinilytica TaxID=2683194 RepID=UPI00193B9651
MYRLTEKQKQIIDIEKMFENTSINTLGFVADFKFQYSYKEINQVLNNIVRCIDAFQIRYFEKDNILYQRFENFQYENFPQLDFSYREREYEEFKNKHMSKCYFQKAEKLYDIYVIKKPNGKMAFGVFMHHSISDAWSLVEIFSRKVCQYFLGKEDSKDSNESFESYLKNSLEEKSNSVRMERNKRYWNRALENYNGINQYPKIFSTDELLSRRNSFILSREESELIMKESKNCGVTLPVLFLSSLILLKTYEAHSESVSMGVAFLGRKKKERKIFGEFVHLLPLLVNVNKDMNVKEFLSNIRGQQMSLFKHSDYSYNDILNYANRELKEDMDLLEIGYSFQNASYYAEISSVLEDIQWLNSNNQNIPLTVHVSDRASEKTLSLDYDYRISLFNEDDIERMHHRLKYIAKKLLANYNKSNLAIFDIDILPFEERNEITEVFNDVEIDYNKDLNIKEIFE